MRALPFPGSVAGNACGGGHRRKARARRRRRTCDRTTLPDAGYQTHRDPDLQRRRHTARRRTIEQIAARGARGAITRSSAHRRVAFAPRKPDPSTAPLPQLKTQRHRPAATHDPDPRALHHARHRARAVRACNFRAEAPRAKPCTHPHRRTRARVARTRQEQATRGSMSRPTTSPPPRPVKVAGDACRRGQEVCAGPDRTPREDGLVPTARGPRRLPSEDARGTWCARREAVDRAGQQADMSTSASGGTRRCRPLSRREQSDRDGRRGRRRRSTPEAPRPPGRGHARPGAPRGRGRRGRAEQEGAPLFELAGAPGRGRSRPRSSARHPGVVGSREATREKVGRVDQYHDLCAPGWDQRRPRAESGAKATPVIERCVGARGGRRSRGDAVERGAGQGGCWPPSARARRRWPNDGVGGGVGRSSGDAPRRAVRGGGVNAGRGSRCTAGEDDLVALTRCVTSRRGRDPGVARSSRLARLGVERADDGRPWIEVRIEEMDRAWSVAANHASRQVARVGKSAVLHVRGGGRTAARRTRGDRRRTFSRSRAGQCSGRCTPPAAKGTTPRQARPRRRSRRRRARRGWGWSRLRPPSGRDSPSGRAGRTASPVVSYEFQACGFPSSVGCYRNARKLDSPLTRPRNSPQWTESS